MNPSDSIPGRSFHEDLCDYKSVISDPEIKKFRRRVWISSVLPIGYVLYDLSLVSETTSQSGISVQGLTEGKLLSFFLVAVLYFTVSYFWNIGLRCRGFPENFLREIWKMCLARDETAGLDRGYLQAEAEDVEHRDLRATLSGFTNNRLVQFIDLFGLPWVFPGVIFTCAVAALGYEVLS